MNIFENIYLYLYFQTNTPGVLIEAANKVFVSNQYKTNSVYEDALKRFYQSEIETLSFSQPAIAAQNINNWVARNTHGEIQNLIDAGTLGILIKHIQLSK